MTQQFNQDPNQGGAPNFGNPRDAKAQAKADKAYRKASRPWFKKKRVLLPLLLVIFVVIIAVSTSGGGSDSENSGGDASSAFPGAKSSDVVGQAGEGLKLGETTVTATQVVPGDSTLGPTLCTSVTLNNGSGDTIAFNVFDWKLQSPSGTILTTGFSGTSNLLSSGQIAPGGSATGDVCFDGAPASGQYVVFYEPTFSFFSDRGAWLNTL